MSSDQTDCARLEGRFGAPGPAAWFSAGLGALLGALGLMFWMGDEHRELTRYFALPASLLLLLFILSWLRVGRFRLTTHALEGSRRPGGSFHVPLVELGVPRLRANDIEWRDKSARQLLRLPRVEPRELAGLLWFHQAFASPWQGSVAAAAAAFLHRCPTRGFFTPVRREWLDGERPASTDSGVLVSFSGDFHVYLPACESTEISVTSAIAGRQGAVRSRRPAGSPSPETIPVAPIVRALLDSAAPDEEKRRLLSEMAEALGGAVLHGPIDGEGRLQAEDGRGRQQVWARTAKVPQLDDAASDELVATLDAVKAARNLAAGLSLGVVGAGVTAFIASVDIARRLALGLGVVGVGMVLLGLGALLEFRKFSMAVRCRRCNRGLARAEGAFYLEYEDKVLGALTLGDEALLENLQPLPPGDLTVGVLLEYCPECTAVGQVTLFRREGWTEPLLGAKAPVSGALVAALRKKLEGV